MKNDDISDFVNSTGTDVPKRTKQFVLFLNLFNKRIETATIESPVDYLRKWTCSLKKKISPQER